MQKLKKSNGLMEARDREMSNMTTNTNLLKHAVAIYIRRANIQAWLSLVGQTKVSTEGKRATGRMLMPLSSLFSDQSD